MASQEYEPANWHASVPPTGNVSVLVRPKYGRVLVTAIGRCWHFAEQYCVPQLRQQIDYRNCYASIPLSVPQLNSLQGQYDPRLFNTAPVILQYLYLQFSGSIVTGGYIVSEQDFYKYLEPNSSF